MEFLSQLTGQIAESPLYSAQRKADKFRLGKEEAERLRKQKCEKRKKENKVATFWLTLFLTIFMEIVGGVLANGLGFLFAILVSPVFYGIIRGSQSNPYM